MNEILLALIVIELGWLCYQNSDLPRVVRGWRRKRR
jgi:hypothetical protein